MRSCILNSSSKKRTAYRVTYQPPQADAQGDISFLRQPARYSVTAQTPLQGLLPRARYRQYFLHGESGCTLTHRGNGCTQVVICPNHCGNLGSPIGLDRRSVILSWHNKYRELLAPGLRKAQDFVRMGLS